MRVGSGKKERIQRTLDNVRQAANSFIIGLETGVSAQEIRRLGSSAVTVDSVLAVLHDSCDIANRFGGYAGHTLRKYQQIGTVDILLYDYSLSCGRRSFLLAYRLSPRIELVTFEMLRSDSENPVVREIREAGRDVLK